MQSALAMRSKLVVAVLVAAFVLASVGCQAVWAWSNGGYSSDPTHPDYGTHDWIAEHALDWLPTQEKQFLTDNLASYLYGTELPDNKNTPDGVGDTTKHHIYFYANGTVQDDAAALRAKQEYANAQALFEAGNFSGAAEHLGMVAHYISDMAVFGHVMGASTAWGTEKHHSDYEDYVDARTGTYQSTFDTYLAFDGALTAGSAYDEAVAVAQDTTFGGSSELSCLWMDQHYSWVDAAFKGRCGESLNLAVNAVTDMLHGFAVAELGVAASPTPTPTVAPTSPTATPVITPTATSSLAPSASASPDVTASPLAPEFPVGYVLVLAVAVSAGLLCVKLRWKSLFGKD